MHETRRAYTVSGRSSGGRVTRFIVGGRALQVIVSVAIDVPVFKLFDYVAVGDSENLPGRRVGVNLAGRRAIGVVMAVAATSDLPANKLKPVLELFDDMPPLPPATLQLIRFCADYYHAPIGVVAAAVLPALFRRNTVSRPAGGYRLGDNYQHAQCSRRKARQVCEWLQGRKTETAAAIKEHTGAGIAVLRRLVDEGILIHQDCESPIVSATAADTPPTLTPAQTKVLAKIKTAAGYAPYLLFGDTGAGKTEVYLRLAEKVLEDGGQALILTPEIHLTPQLEESFARRFPERRVCVLHSGLTDSERARRWLLAVTGNAAVVLGTRLAVFTPLPKLRLIVVDEEHDDSYKQEEGLLFSARDVAVWRANHEKVTLVCGSATPSLESYENARRQRYQLLRMDSRARQGRLEVALINQEGAMFHGMTQQFLSKLADTLAYGRQALIFINRRGYAPMLTCQQCQWTVLCSACESRMTWHKRRGQLICHRCGRMRAEPAKCELCSSPLAAVGIGTQRVEEALSTRFAPIKAVRLDSDALASRDSFATLRENIASGATQLLVGTKIVAKGHDFPHLSFIGILNADASLWSADFRAEERLLTMLRQVIGRGTRNTDGCQAFIQTAQPAHPFYGDLLADDLTQCWQRLLEERRRAKLPPFAYCALLRASAETEARLELFFNKALSAAAQVRLRDVRVCDPVPSPIAKLSKRWRWQLLVQAPTRPPLHSFLAAWRKKLPNSGEVRWNLDIDPLQI